MGYYILEDKNVISKEMERNDEWVSALFRAKKNIIMTKTLDVSIKDYTVYNNKVVIVEFADGAKEKAVCHEDDKFDLEIGIQTCILKRLLGGTGKMNNMVRKVIKEHNKIKEDKEKAENDARLAKIRKEKMIQKKIDKKRKKAIEIQKEAYIAAARELEKNNG